MSENNEKNFVSRNVAGLRVVASKKGTFTDDDGKVVPMAGGLKLQLGEKFVRLTALQGAALYHLLAEDGELREFLESQRRTELADLQGVGF